ncbi:MULTISPECIES: winged helix-turn-helix transcriptional regulator [Denitromonas]|jgi:Lrp/AsnC family leucine-responsive transcriptional regulator|uniref:Winged helix-turn-helix transcriptional regulator n=2 Tax=Denitromonas TaxID=139331 RepID=A0A557RPQ9_9RHOO|nr:MULTISPECIES: winged helix-turn-helix transcriptional regulator [Denitromonas]TVO58632.1 winged helix-turn-helix transcriptional regulator [Denitromonas halophila]TVO67167.1 winged helix-turn-helix transcriptional regulator [Denitromonas ohlonensis]TVO79227.1 winged helix-turn-helix transcriptional regulator [Denitromonas ohlonensis]TVT50901.1 MAG: winged helix-turn-helix transcriptional regulator [Denitromonas halophila]TVT68119.1 MAG: winged helix-turn-helix transcriptional regulator [Den
MRELDRLDRKILDLLQKNGRLPMTELADKVGLSSTPCTERVRRLERDGVITGYHAHLNPVALGKPLLVFVEIKLSAKSGDVFDKVKHEMLFIPEVMECHLVSGEFDYLIKARISQMGEYRRLLGNILLKLPGATESRSSVVMEEIKETLFLPTD